MLDPMVTLPVPRFIVDVDVWASRIVWSGREARLVPGGNVTKACCGWHVKNLAPGETSSKIQVMSVFDPNLTVGLLREAMKDLPDDAPVYYERIEDVYFEKHGWTTEPRPNPDGYNDCPPSQFIRAFTPIRYKDDNGLYITAHF
jgi:hypothetical protein